MPIFPDSGFRQQKFPRFWNTDSLTWGDLQKHKFLLYIPVENLPGCRVNLNVDYKAIVIKIRHAVLKIFEQLYEIFEQLFQF